MNHLAPALRYHMFEGDDTPVRTLRDRIGYPRSDRQCVICQGLAPAGKPARILTQVLMEGSRPLMSFYACEPCCEAIVAAVHGRDEPINHRTSIGLKRARGDL